MSQPELAKKARIAQSFIGALEAGNQKTSGYLPEIAHALDIDAYWLKTGLGNRPHYLKPGADRGKVVELRREEDTDPHTAEIVAMLKETDEEGRILCKQAVRSALKDHAAAGNKKRGQRR